MLRCKKCKANKIEQNKKFVCVNHRYYPNSRQQSDICIICGWELKNIPLSRDFMPIIGV